MAGARSLRAACPCRVRGGRKMVSPAREAARHRSLGIVSRLSRIMLGGRLIAARMVAAWRGSACASRRARRALWSDRARPVPPARNGHRICSAPMSRSMRSRVASSAASRRRLSATAKARIAFSNNAIGRASLRCASRDISRSVADIFAAPIAPGKRGCNAVDRRRKNFDPRSDRRRARRP